MSFVANLLEPVLYGSFRKAKANNGLSDSKDIQILGRGTVILTDEAIKGGIAQINRADLKAALQKSEQVRISLETNKK